MEVGSATASSSGGFWGNQEVFVGSTLELSCSGSGSAPVTVKWSKAGADTLEDNVKQRGNGLRYVRRNAQGINSKAL